MAVKSGRRDKARKSSISRSSPFARVARAPLRVAIIGSVAKRKHFRQDDEVKIWGFNAIRPKWVPYWSCMFNLHTYDNLIRYNWPVEVDMDWANSHPAIEFYTLDEWPMGTLRKGNAVIFPRELCHRPDYHCGSFDWLVAFAVALHAKEIMLHGVSLSMGGEPLSARACLEYHCGYAEGRGCKITVAPDCDLFNFHHLVRSNLVYGYDDTPLYEDKTRDAVPGNPPYTYGD